MVNFVLMTYTISIILGLETINIDPQFTDPDNGDFTLQPSSPCIDAGDPESDLDPDGTIADMGAYPYDQIANPIIWGCMDEEACNYDQEAMNDDESCIYFTDLCGVSCGDNSSCDIISDIDGNEYGTVRDHVIKHGWFDKI